MSDKALPRLMELFEYNDYFNIKLIEAIQPNLEKLPKRAEEIMNHILNSHTFWNNRITGKPDIPRWTVHPYDELLKINEVNHEITTSILETRDLEDRISFKNSKGGTSTVSIGDIYFHLVNHGSYHRAQLAILFRQSGLEPIQTDYIWWKIWVKDVEAS